MTEKDKPPKVRKVRQEEGRKIKVKGPDEREAAAWNPNEATTGADRGENVDEPKDPWTTSMRPWKIGERPSEIPVNREAFADLVDLDSEYRILIETPGIPRKNLKVIVTNKSVEVNGETSKDLCEEAKEHGYIFRERSTSIHKKFAFPEEVIPDKATATLESGLLDVRVPKKTST